MKDKSVNNWFTELQITQSKMHFRRMEECLNKLGYPGNAITEEHSHHTAPTGKSSMDASRDNAQTP